MAKDFPPPSNDNIRLDTCAGNLQVCNLSIFVSILTLKQKNRWKRASQPCELLSGKFADCGAMCGNPSLVVLQLIPTQD